MTKKILLVEDDPMLIDIYRTKFEENGFEVDVAEDGEEALRKIEKSSPLIVLLDIVLPQHDGWDVLEMIKEKQAPVKVFVLSNLGQKEEIQRGLDLGAEKYLIKAHYTPSQIVEEINKEFIQ